LGGGYPPYRFKPSSQRYNQFGLFVLINEIAVGVLSKKKKKLVHVIFNL